MQRALLRGAGVAVLLWASLALASAGSSDTPKDQCEPVHTGMFNRETHVGIALRALTGSPYFGGYMETLLRKAPLSICIATESVTERGSFEPAKHRITLRSGLTTGQTIVILAHELRHLDQHRRGYRLSLDHDLREHVRQTFALEADAQAFAVLIAFTLKDKAGQKAKAAAKEFAEFGDIAMTFETASRLGRTRHEATRLAFRQWYRNRWRREKYCLAATAAYLDQLDATKALRRYELLAKTHFVGLCQLPRKGNYGCVNTPEIEIPVALPCIK